MTSPALLDLAVAFDEARRSAQQRARFAADDPGAPPLTCRYCGEHWRRWAGSVLDGHARCIVTPEFVELAIATWRADPTLNVDAIAEALGVSKSTVNAWVSPLAVVRRANRARRAV